MTTDELPKRIGPYRILQVLGEGGMGVVYEAEQDVPVTRRVALKVIKRGMDSRQVLARFDAERQALAVMDHPAIAKVFDAGTTETGQPYVAMERVSGVPLTEYCDSHRLSTTERLHIFVELCRAIQHAHQKGVIHRDLKPSNILVSEQDGRRLPKVIDFGIAKAVGRRLTAQTLVTEFGEVVGTPAYMSPEQAENSGLDVDTRTDIFSLGVILYELLVGALPIDPASVGLGPFIVRLAHRSTNPPTPSTKVGSLGNREQAVAEQRRTDPATLRRELRGDLDWITMKALELDRTRRYESATELAADLERHLRSEPVLARKPSALYRGQKFVARHRVGVAISAVLVLALAASSIVMTISRNDARRAGDVARGEAAKATAVNDFLLRMLSSANPDAGGGRNVTVASLLDTAEATITSSFPSQPEVEAAVRFTVARSYRGLGLFDPAWASAARSLELRRRTLPAGDPAIAESANELAIIAQARGDLGGADSLFREALAIWRAAYGPDAGRAAEGVNNLGQLVLAKGDFKLADSLFRVALDIRLRAFGDEHVNVVESRANVGAAALGLGNFAAAESLYRGALATRQKLKGDDLDAAVMMNQLALALGGLGRYPSADTLQRASLAINRRILGDNHPTVARSLNNLGLTNWRMRNYAVAEPLIRQALAINVKVHGETHPTVSSNVGNLALILRDQRKFGEAEPLLRRAIALDQRLFGENHPEVATQLNNLGGLYGLAGRLPEAERTFRRALAIQKQAFAADSWQVATTESLIADCLNKQRRFKEAEPLAVRAYEIIDKQFGAAHGRTRAAIGRVISAYEGLGRTSDANRYRGLLPQG